MGRSFLYDQTLPATSTSRTIETECSYPQDKRKPEQLVAIEFSNRAEILDSLIKPQTPCEGKERKQERGTSSDLLALTDLFYSSPFLCFMTLLVGNGELNTRDTCDLIESSFNPHGTIDREDLKLVVTKTFALVFSRHNLIKKSKRYTFSDNDHYHQATYYSIKGIADTVYKAAFIAGALMTYYPEFAPLLQLQSMDEPGLVLHLRMLASLENGMPQSISDIKSRTMPDIVTQAASNHINALLGTRVIEYVGQTVEIPAHVADSSLILQTDDYRMRTGETKVRQIIDYVNEHDDIPNWRTLVQALVPQGDIEAYEKMQLIMIYLREKKILHIKDNHIAIDENALPIIYNHTDGLFFEADSYNAIVYNVILQAQRAKGKPLTYREMSKIAEEAVKDHSLEDYERVHARTHEVLSDLFDRGALVISDSPVENLGDYMGGKESESELLSGSYSRKIRITPKGRELLDVMKELVYDPYAFLGDSMHGHDTSSFVPIPTPPSHIAFVRRRKLTEMPRSYIEIMQYLIEVGLEKRKHYQDARARTQARIEKVME